MKPTEKYKVFETFSLCTIEASLVYASCPCNAGFYRALRIPRKAEGLKLLWILGIGKAGSLGAFYGSVTGCLSSPSLRGKNWHPVRKVLERISNLKSVVFLTKQKLQNPPGTVRKGLYNDSLGKQIYRLYSFLPPARPPRRKKEKRYHSLSEDKCLLFHRPARLGGGSVPDSTMLTPNMNLTNIII